MEVRRIPHSRTPRHILVAWGSFYAVKVYSQNHIPFRLHSQTREWYSEKTLPTAEFASSVVFLTNDPMN